MLAAQFNSIQTFSTILFVVRDFVLAMLTGCSDWRLRVRNWRPFATIQMPNALEGGPDSYGTNSGCWQYFFFNFPRATPGNTASFDYKSDFLHCKKHTINFTSDAMAEKLPKKWRKICVTSTMRLNLQYTENRKKMTIFNPYCELQERFRFLSG